LAQPRKIARACGFFRAYTGEETWKDIGDRLQKPWYLSRVDHDRKIGSREQRTDIANHSFLSRTIQVWNQLSADVLGTLCCMPSNFRKVINEAK
jgi:hypothetical protein